MYIPEAARLLHAPNDDHARPFGHACACSAACLFQTASSSHSSSNTTEQELEEAEDEVNKAAASGRVGSSQHRVLASVLEVASLVFLAEWGDRSMLATVALGAAQVG